MIGVTIWITYTCMQEAMIILIFMSSTHGIATQEIEDSMSVEENHI